MWWFWITVGTLISWAVLSARHILYPERCQQTIADTKPELSSFSIDSLDKTSFDVWHLKPPSRPLGHLLFFHGYYANRYQVLWLADALRNRGYTGWLIEMRGHGDRKGPCTLSVRESEDALQLIRWINANANESKLPIAVVGFSMGATVACRVALRFPGITAVIADSAYARLYPIIRENIKQRYYLPRFFSWITWKAVQLFLLSSGGILEPTDMAKRINKPLLAIQAGCDTVVAASDGDEFYESWQGLKERWIDNKADHVKMFEENPEAYTDRVVIFLKNAMRS